MTLTAPTFAPPAGLAPMRPSLPATAVPATQFADVFKDAVGEASRLQNEATGKIEAFQLGETDDVTGVMAAVEKGELALKTLVAIRGKLMAAFDEIRNMPI